MPPAGAARRDSKRTFPRKVISALGFFCYSPWGCGEAWCPRSFLHLLEHPHWLHSVYGVPAIELGIKIRLKSEARRPTKETLLSYLYIKEGLYCTSF